MIRSLFDNEVPEWLVELYGLLDYVNFINLTPTIVAILTAPDHFFARVYLLTNRRRVGIKEDLFKSPIKMVTTVATLILTTKWLAPYVPVPRQKEILSLLLVSLPFWIPAICLALRVVAELSYAVIFRGLQSVLLNLIPTFKAIAFLNFEQGLRYLMVPLSPYTYTALDPKRMFWNGLYFFGYVISLPLLSFTMFFVGVRLLYGVTIHGLSILDYASSLHVPSMLSLTAVMDVVAVLVLVFGRLVIYPYTIALLYSLRRPTRLSRRIEMHQYLRAAELLAYKAAPFVGAAGNAQNPETVTQARNALRNELIVFRHAWHGFEHNFLRWKLRFKVGGAASESERSNLLTSYEGLDVLHAHLVEGALCDRQIDLLVSWVKSASKVK